MAAVACPQCGGLVDRSTGRCVEGHEITSEHLIAVASTIDNAAHEVGRRSAAIESGERTDEADALIGRTFGKYVVLGLIGRGGMGAVYKVRHEELGHFAAIKVLEGRLVGSQDIIARLFREARAAAQIGHVNIVQVHDFGRDPDVGGYIVMEFLRGSSLEEVLTAERRLDEPRVRAIGLEICDALAAAHAKGIVHRDLKPANVFLQTTRRGELVKVMDFGIAKVAESLGESATQPGTILGTPRYMSPEQWCSEPVDARSDIYSFGVMLYRMTTGALPHPKATSLPQLARVVTERIQPKPREVTSSVSEAMEAIIFKCCEPNPDDRYASMEEVAQALRPLTVDAPRSARSGAPSLPLGQTRGPVAYAIGAAVALAIGIVVVGTKIVRGGGEPSVTAGISETTIGHPPPPVPIPPAALVDLAPSATAPSAPANGIADAGASAVASVAPGSKGAAPRALATASAPKTASPPASGKKVDDVLFGQ